MLLCNRHRMLRLIVAAVFITIGGAPCQPVADETMGFVRDEYRKIISALDAIQRGDDSALLSQWHDHVAKTTRFSNDDYLAAIGELQADYYREIVNYEKAIEAAKYDAGNHSSEWLEDLIHHFGEDYVKKNRNAILENIMLLFHSRHEFYFRKVSEKLVYKETVLYNAYRGYFELSSEFWNALSREGQDSLRPQKEAAGAFLLLLSKHSVTNMLTAGKMPSKKILTIRARRHDVKLISFFKKYTTARNFNPLKAAKDISRVTEEH